MFKASIDNKKIIQDPNGNEIVDLTSSTFRVNQKISQYFLRKVPSDYRMRPDLIALTELGTTDKTEYIMMFNQIGNPFSIDRDDVLLIPELIEADSMIWSGNESPTMDEDTNIQDILVKNYYKHSNRDNTVDMSSYDDFLNTEIPSGNPTANTDTLEQGEGRAPYMLRGNEEAIIIRNGRIYFNDENDVALGGGSGTGNGTGQGGSFPTDSSFGTGSGWPGGDSISVSEIDNTNVDAKIQSIINGVNTEWSEKNCTYNGTNLGDFIKALNSAQ